MSNFWKGEMSWGMNLVFILVLFGCWLGIILPTIPTHTPTQQLECVAKDEG